MRIFDVFLFYNEFDILDIRYSELYHIIDQFVLVEAPFSFTMKEKPYYYKDKNDSHKDKIHNITIPKESMINLKMNGNDVHYVERFQRNYVTEYLNKTCQDDDIIIFSDVDEIPTMDIIATFIGKGKSCARYRTKLYRYFYNLYFQDWPNSHIFRWGKMKDWINNIDSIRYSFTPAIIDSFTGWHFSGIGNAAYLVDKLNNKSISNEKRIKPYLNRKHIENRIKLKLHPFRDDRPEGTVDHLDNMPQFIQSNLSYFSNNML